MKICPKEYLAHIHIKNVSEIHREPRFILF